MRVWQDEGVYGRIGSGEWIATANELKGGGTAYTMGKPRLTAS